MNIILIAVTVLVSIVAFSNRELFDKLKFYPYQIKNQKQSWRFMSYALVHASWMHLLINMWVLYSFGSIVLGTFQLTFGTKGIFYYLLLYVGGVLFSTLFDYGKYKNNVYYTAVGASGAVSAVVFASILIYPTSRIGLFPIPIGIPAWIFGILYLIYSVYMQKRGTDNVGHSAHFWGAIFGLIFTIIVVPGVIQSFIQQMFG
ncbi:MAG: rhomboid family intramembrane serine protease [Bacteroidales bacterium]|nr:rhomboid family intramembrane serine protease [Bacteroidales bacterium]